jgi:hypothetical protein
MAMLRAFVTKRPSAWTVRVEMIENSQVVFADNECIFVKDDNIERVRKPLLRSCLELDFDYITLDGPDALYATTQGNPVAKRAILRMSPRSLRLELVAAWDISSAPSWEAIAVLLKNPDDIQERGQELDQNMAI